MENKRQVQLLLATIHNLADSGCKSPRKRLAKLRGLTGPSLGAFYDPLVLAESIITEAERECSSGRVRSLWRRATQLMAKRTAGAFKGRKRMKLARRA